MAEQFVFTFNGAYLKAVVNAYRQLVDTFVFHFTRENIKACVMSTDRYRLIEIVFTPYDYRAHVDEVWVQGDMGLLWGAVKKLKKADTVTVKVEDDKFHVGPVQPGEVVPEEWIEPEQKFDLEVPTYFEQVVVGSLKVVVSGFKKILRSAPPDTTFLGIDIDEPGGHILLGESVVDLGEPHEWLLGVSGKVREPYTLDLFTSLLVSGLTENAHIYITEKAHVIVEYAEDQCTVKLYMSAPAQTSRDEGKETITEILARPKPVRTLILRMGKREAVALLKTVKAIDYLTENGEIAFDLSDGLGLFWQVGYLKVSPQYLEMWVPPPVLEEECVFPLADLVKHLKGVVDLRLYYDAEKRLVLWGTGPNIAPKELMAQSIPLKVEVPKVEGKIIFTGPADLLLRTVEDAKVAEDKYLVFYTTPYEIEVFGQNEVYYEATFELNDFQAVEEDYVPIGSDTFSDLIGFFKNVPATWVSVGKTPDDHVYLSCATDIGEFRAIRPQYYLKEAIEAYEERMKRPVAPPEAEKLPEVPPKPEYLNIPYGIESLVGARVSYLEAILPDWKLVGRLGPLTSPDGKISMHAHFTEISEDLAPQREDLMEAMKKIHEVFRALSVEQIMSSAALEPFKEKTRPYADTLRRVPKPPEVAPPLPPPLPTNEEIKNRIVEFLTEEKRRTWTGIVNDVIGHFKILTRPRLIELNDKFTAVMDELLKEGVISEVGYMKYEIAVLPPPKLLDPAKPEVAEIRSLSRGPFRFVILNDGTLSVASMGRFLGKEELEGRPELLAEAQGYFLEELETLGIRPPAFELVTVYPSTHINEFTGVDKKLYGPFEAGEAALIPRENAEKFVKEHFASWEKLLTEEEVLRVVPWKWRPENEVLQELQKMDYTETNVGEKLEQLITEGKIERDGSGLFLKKKQPPEVAPPMPPVPTNEEIRNRILEFLKEEKTSTRIVINIDVVDHFKVKEAERLRELTDKFNAVMDELLKEGVISEVGYMTYAIAVPLPPKPPEIPPPAVRTYAELEKEFEEKDPWDALAIFVSRFEGFKRDYSMEDLHRFLRELRERTSTESVYRFYKIYPQLKDDFVSIASRIGWIPPELPTPPPAKPPRRPPPARLKPEEVEEVWEQFVAFAKLAEIVEPLVYRDRFMETIRTSPTVANAIERARRLVSSIQRELRPPTVLPAPPLVPVPDVAEVYRRLGVPPGAPVSEAAFQTVWRAIQRERAVEPPKGLIRSELDYLWREFADFLRKFDMDPERHRPEFDEVINPDFNLVENLEGVMKKVHELTDSGRWGPERWR